jgi:N-methylhydantoinase B/oxoprolinase/acetone carboxylase alpha subunit
VHVDAGEDLRVLLRSLGLNLDDDILDRLTALLQNMHDIEGGAGFRGRSAPAPWDSVLNPFDVRFHHCHLIITTQQTVHLAGLELNGPGRDGRRQNLAFASGVSIEPGDEIVIRTANGCGWGRPDGDG